MSKTISLEDLEHLGRLARVGFSKDEEEKMLHDIQAILGYVSEINEMSIMERRNQEDVSNIVREDEVTHQGGELTEALLSCAPREHGGHVQVTQVIK